MVATDPQTPNRTPENNILLEWTSPSRPFAPRSREFYKTAGALVFLFSIIFIFIGEILLIGVILAAFFMVYVLSSVKPEMIKHTVTTLGVETAGHFHRWEELYEFWFEERFGEHMVVIRTLLGFPAHLQLLIGDISQEKIKSLFSDRIPYREKPEKTFLDNASSWLMQKIPFERTS